MTPQILNAISPSSDSRPRVGLKDRWRRWRAARSAAGAAAGVRRVRVAGQTAPTPPSYLDPAALSKFGLNPLLARRVVEGFITGLHRSPFHGVSVEFADHREYVPGDDLKYLDWYLYARTDEYYIKRFEEETNLRCYILLDHSGSMAFGTAELTKWDYACFLSSCLAYLMLKQQDAVGLSLFGASPLVMVPPRCRQTHLRQLMATMLQNPPTGSTDLPYSLRAIVRNLKRRGLVVVISDLIDEPEKMMQTLRLLKSHQHDVIVFHLEDPAEIEFPFTGAGLFRDLETGEEMEIDPASVRKEYLERREAFNQSIRSGLVHAGVDYCPVDTRQPYDKALSAYLRRRAQTAK